MAPVTNPQSSIAIWPGENGQLIVRRRDGDAVEPSWLSWPGRFRPRFEFGSPYQSQDGQFWQIGFDADTNGFVYVRLGAPQPEIARSETPRLCSGTLSYRFATSAKGDPWLTGESAHDSPGDKFALPLIESAVLGAFLGLRVDHSGSLEDLLNSDDRQRAILFRDDDDSHRAFHTIAVVKPMRSRAFVHGGKLWLYHPHLAHVAGWEIAQ
jgi:hypothetical protein